MNKNHNLFVNKKSLSCCCAIGYERWRSEVRVIWALVASERMCVHRHRYTRAEPKKKIPSVCSPSLSTSGLYITHHLQPNITVRIGEHTHKYTHTCAQLQARVYTGLIMNHFLHEHTHWAHGEGTSIHTSACARKLCYKDLYDKVADRQWGWGPAHRAADADSLIALTVHVCKCVRACPHLRQCNWIPKPCWWRK